MILITGATGLVGAHIAYDLASSGRKIRCLRRQGSSMKVIQRVFSADSGLLELIEWVEGDVTDIFSILDALNDVSEVYHAAAIISFHPSEVNEMMRVNAQGTANMINLSLEKGVSKFCHISSVAALGRIEEGRVITENSVWKTSSSNSAYAISKYSAEREAWRGMEEGLKVCIVNPSIVLGPGDWNRGSSKLFRQVWKGLRFYTEGATGFVDVRDVARCAVQLMDREIFGKRFILNSENLSYKDLLGYIAKGFDKAPPAIPAKAWMAELFWRLEWFRSFFSGSSPLITKETSRNSRKKWAYSNERICQELAFSFIPVEQSVKHTCEVYRQEWL